MATMTIRRARKEPALAAAAEAAPGRTAAPPAPAPQAQPEVTVQKVPEKQRKPLTPEQLSVSRRQFLNRAWTASFLTFLGLFGMSTLSFLWPKLTGGFGTTITAGNYEDLLKEIGPANNYKPKFVAEGRFWLTYYEGTGDSPV